MKLLIMTAVRDYTVHVDNKKRVTLRGALYQYYNIKESDIGCIMLEPRELKVPETISKATLRDIDRASYQGGVTKVRFCGTLIFFISL